MSGERDHRNLSGRLRTAGDTEGGHTNGPTDRSTEAIHSRAASQRLRMKAIVLSVAVSILLLTLKWVAFRLTNSAAVLSDALESIVNVAASGFALVSIRAAVKPPDPDHPYGHGKIEYFSAGFEGALIVGAAAGIFYSGIAQLLAPRPLPHLDKGLLILAGATLINLALGVYLVRTGRRTESAALMADGRHVLTDVYSSAAVAAGLLLVFWTGWLRLDGAVACLVGLVILFTGGQLVLHSFQRLMDTSDPEVLERIARLLSRNKRPVWIDIHQLRAFRAGAMVHIDLHLVLPDHMRLSRAHQEAKILERMLREEFRGAAGVLVHMDPCQPEQCPICSSKECPDRAAEKERARAWDTGRMIRPSADLPPEKEKDS